MNHTLTPYMTTGQHPTKLYFGVGLLSRFSECVWPLMQAFGQQDLLLLCSPQTQTRNWFPLLAQALSAVQANYQTFHVAPFFDQEFLRKIQAEFPQGALIVACGGGSVMDAAKILRQLYTQTGMSCPLVNWPTTSGSGSEVTPFATYWNTEPPQKQSLECEFPDLACIDPQLALTQPPMLRLSCGLDAIIQALEALWNQHAQTQASHWAQQALQLAIPALQQLQNLSPAELQAQGLAAQTDLSQASLLSGLAISYTRTALCHSLSYPLSAHLGIPHGLACAFSLPEVWHFNLSPKARTPTLSALIQKIADLFQAQGLRCASPSIGLPHQAEQLTSAWQNWLEQLNVPDILAPYFHSCSLAQAQQIEQSLYAPERADRNLRSPTEQDVRTIFHKALQRWALPWPLKQDV